MICPGPQLLRDWLKRHRLSQGAIAARVGVTQAAISRIVRGEARPRLVVAEKIATATRFASAEDRCLVEGVPVSAWLSAEDVREVEALRTTVFAVRSRSRDLL